MFRFQVVGCVVGCCIAPALGQPASAQPTYRGGVDLVSVTAVVSDRSGRPVRSLDRDDFQVFDDGELRPSSISGQTNPRHSACRCCSM